MARTVRRLGLVPSGAADRLGEDESLRGVVLPHEAMVFFPDPPGSLYQVEQWYAPLRALDAEMRTVVVLRDSRTARSVRARSGLDVVVAAEPSTVEGLVRRGQFRLALYVNHHPDNFTNLRLGQLVHVSLMHGDSDKQVTVSNQVKAYDFNFVAGEAAVTRMAASSVLYDAADRCLAVGRPQVDEMLRLVEARRAERREGVPTTVLYAPTWEGPPGVSEYGSLVSHGEPVVRSLVEAGYQVIFRPHPLSGVRSSEYAAAEARVRTFLDDEGHRIDSGGVSVGESFADADVLLCDVSALAMDWLATGRPILCMRPAGDDAVAVGSPIASVVPWVEADDAGAVADRVAQVLQHDAYAEDRAALVEHYLGDNIPGAATARFVAACRAVVERYDAAVAERDARMHTGA